MVARGLGLLAVVVAPAAARADGPSVIAAVMETADVQAGHTGVYLIAGAGWNMLGRGYTVTPMIAVSVSPETERWGGIVGVSADLPVSSRIGIDFGFFLASDQSGGDFGDAFWSLQIGPG